MNLSNTISVATLIEEIQSELKHQTGSWRKVSELLNQADVEFGFGADEMKQILDQTDISPSKASKLISIAQDDRIRQNSKIFEMVSIWTTLCQYSGDHATSHRQLANVCFTPPSRPLFQSCRLLAVGLRPRVRSPNLRPCALCI